MRKPPESPTSLRPQGEKIAILTSTLIIDSMEQSPYSFRAFPKWFATIERRKLPAGDYSIAGLEEMGDGSREDFVRACERLCKLDFAALVIEGALTKILPAMEFSGMHPNTVFGTTQALAVRWGIQSWFAPSRALAEEITACLLHKAYQVITLEQRGLPRRFVKGDIEQSALRAN